MLLSTFEKSRVQRSFSATGCFDLFRIVVSYACLFVVSAVRFAPYLTDLCSMMLILAAVARCK